MLTVNEAFDKFKSRLEISDSEQADASRRQQTIRDQVREGFALDHDFLTGSYARHTKTRPLKDVDIFVVLGGSEADYLERPLDAVLDHLIEILSPRYPGKTTKGNRSIGIDFGVASGTDDRVVSFDIVPAFADGDAYSIPDRSQGRWIKSNPRIHAEEATAANDAARSHPIMLVDGHRIL